MKDADTTYHQPKQWEVQVLVLAKDQRSIDWERKVILSMYFIYLLDNTPAPSNYEIKSVFERTVS
jgi:hypothetical protein